MKVKQLLLAGTAFLALAASLSTAKADPIVFDFTGSVVSFMVPTTGTYQILALGAQGGSVSNGPGGRGAEIGGNFNLNAGEILRIAVGGEAPSNLAVAAGGGGGSFVVGPGNTPLVIAGGGGGGGGASALTRDAGEGGLTGPNGGGPGGGTNGSGGSTATPPDFFPPGAVTGGGGGGFLTAGGSDFVGAGGGSFPDLAGGIGRAGANGGFGGGGGGGGASGSGGGGGGYSGGASGGCVDGDCGSPNDVNGRCCEAGYGGGSFDAGGNQILMADFQTGNGEVIITELVAEPASLAILGAGLVSFLGLVRLRRYRS